MVLSRGVRWYCHVVSGFSLQSASGYNVTLQSLLCMYYNMGSTNSSSAKNYVILSCIIQTINSRPGGSHGLVAQLVNLPVIA